MQRDLVWAVWFLMAGSGSRDSVFYRMMIAVRAVSPTSFHLPRFETSGLYHHPVYVAVHDLAISVGVSHLLFRSIESKCDLHNMPLIIGAVLAQRCGQ